MSSRITIDDKDDVYVRGARRVVVADSVEVVVSACNDVTLANSRVEVWTDNDFGPRGSGNTFRGAAIPGGGK